jgi:hypothetical protein
MHQARTALLVLGVAAGMLGYYQSAAAEVVSYNGDLTLNGGPVPNGFVIAGTFAPTFDPYNYKFVYGDGSGNLLSTEYSQAVADGNFRPIGGGTTTFPDGAFAGSGFNSTGAGHPIYLFAFDHPNPDLAANFALATSPGWITGVSPLSITGADASNFVFGQKAGPTLGLNGLPFPEPSTFALVATLSCVLAPRLRRKSR